MRFVGRKVVYDAAELEQFLPMWRTISADRVLLAQQAELSKKLFWASDSGLCDGTDALAPEAYQFGDLVRRKARQMFPSLSDEELRKFVFYVLYHQGDSPEYDLDVQGNAQASPAGHSTK